MSCNGCRVLRKGCSETCILRPCLQWIESAEAQGHATVFVAKFFGRAGLMSFISAVPDSQRPSLFQSLLYEACGRTVNPVNGAVGLLWTGNWHVCQTAVETVLRGGTLRPLPEPLATATATNSPVSPAADEVSEAEVACPDTNMWELQDPSPVRHSRFSNSRSRASPKQKRPDHGQPTMILKRMHGSNDLDLSLSPTFSPKLKMHKQETVRRPGTPSTMTSEESVTTNTTTTTCFESGMRDQYGNGGGDRQLLNLFV